MTIPEHFKNLVYERSATRAEIHSDLSAIRELDSHFEKRESLWGTIATLLTLGAIAAVIWAFTQDGRFPTVPILSVAIVAAIVCWIIKSRFSKQNTENRRYELLARLLDLLVTDMPEASLFTTRLDLRPAEHSSKYVRKGKVGYWDVRYYEDPWLRLQGRFLDGTAFQLLMIEKHQHRRKVTRSMSGKTKVKTKHKSAHDARLRLKPKAKRYAHLSELGKNPRGAIQVPSFVEFKEITVEEGGLAMKTAAKASWLAPAPGEADVGNSATQWVAMMFLSLYQVLNLSRRMTKKAS